MRAECTSLPVGLMIMMRSVESIDEHLKFCYSFGFYQHIIDFQAKLTHVTYPIYLVIALGSQNLLL